MSIEALVLAVASIVRPTTAATVWAMLIGGHPRRLLSAYLLAGLTFSLTTGIAVVLLLGGVLPPRTPSTARGVVEIALGVAALLAAVGARAGWLRRWTSPAVPGSARRPRRLSPAGVATAGVLTHMPGLFYLAGLGAIATAAAGAAGAVLQVVIYNLIWFAPALVAFALCVRGTAPSTNQLAGLAAWCRAHQDAILAVVFGAVGVWLVAKGVADVS